jgi:hypothetical protein
MRWFDSKGAGVEGTPGSREKPKSRPRKYKKYKLADFGQAVAILDIRPFLYE